MRLQDARGEAAYPEPEGMQIEDFKSTEIFTHFGRISATVLGVPEKFPETAPSRCAETAARLLAERRSGD